MSSDRIDRWIGRSLNDLDPTDQETGIEVDDDDQGSHHEKEQRRPDNDVQHIEANEEHSLLQKRVRLRRKQK